jgi:protein-S-isoprenylcysteine O-methyltransferase Ste14
VSLHTNFYWFAKKLAASVPKNAVCTATNIASVAQRLAEDANKPAMNTTATCSYLEAKSLSPSGGRLLNNQRNYLYKYKSLQPMDFLKIYLPVFLVGFIVLVFVVPSVKVYRQNGINPFRFVTNHDKAHDYIGASMKVFTLLLLVAVFAFSFFGSAYQYLAPFDYLQGNGLKIAGLVLGHLSLVLIMIAQYNMRQSWRIGIDYENKTQLITHGFFSLSRNPIYVSLLAGLIGMFLVLPNAITFAVLFAAYIVLHITMQLEEDFLRKQHGETYVRYKQKVRRLI